MIKKKMVLITLSLIVFVSSSIFCQEKKAKDTEYKKFRAEFFSLYQKGKYIEAAEMLEKNLDKYPSKTPNIAYNAVISYLKAEKKDKAIIMIKKALKRGLFFNKYMLESRLFAPLKSIKEFKDILVLNEEKRAEAQKKAKATFEIVLPDGFDKTQNYPLFIALHGGSGNIKQFKPRWKSELLKKKYITAYVQSSQVISINGYHWGDLKITKKDLKSLYKKIKANYLIDQKNILIGGFSSGGFGSLFSAFKQILPIKGYIVLCPVIPDSISLEDIKLMTKKGLKGTILTSDVDPRIQSQKDFSDKLKKEGIKNQLVITPNIGHWFPKDLDKKIDQAILNIEKL